MDNFLIGENYEVKRPNDLKCNLQSEMNKKVVKNSENTSNKGSQKQTWPKEYLEQLRVINDIPHRIKTPYFVQCI
jgi:hypothetical protein